jgi:hypothetical protein
MAWMVLKWSIFKIVSSDPDLHPTTQGSFQQSLVEIGSAVSEEKIFFILSSLSLFLAWRPSWLEVGITGHNFGRPESAQI